MNYWNPAIIQEMKNILKFWTDKGVDGFRMDAVPFLFEDQEFKDEPLSGKTDDPEDYNYLNHIYTWNFPEVKAINEILKKTFQLLIASLGCLS